MPRVILNSSILGGAQRLTLWGSMKKNQKAFDLGEFLATVNGGRTLATYRKDDVVFSQGDRCDGVFYIRSGDCKISVISELGKEAVVALHKKADFFVFMYAVPRIIGYVSERYSLKSFSPRILIP